MTLEEIVQIIYNTQVAYCEAIDRDIEVLDSEAMRAEVVSTMVTGASPEDIYYGRADSDLLLEELPKEERIKLVIQCALARELREHMA